MCIILSAGVSFLFSQKPYALYLRFDAAYLLQKDAIITEPPSTQAAATAPKSTASPSRSGQGLRERRGKPGWRRGPVPPSPPPSPSAEPPSSAEPPTRERYSPDVDDASESAQRASSGSSALWIGNNKRGVG